MSPTKPSLSKPKTKPTPAATTKAADPSAAADARIRGYWAHKQGLLTVRPKQTAAQVLEQTGWARSVAGVTPYLTLFSRAGLSRADADKALAELAIQELPAARGCTYVVPARDYALALRAAAPSADAPMRPARTIGVTDREIDALCKGVLKALAKGPKGSDELRDATGDLSRSLGEEGKKKGIGTTMPLATGRLQAEGRIRRIPKNGRLDQQRYDYALWEPSPLAKAPATTADEDATELARRFFTWAGPATMAELQKLTGLGVKAAAAAVKPLGLISVGETGLAATRLLLPEERDAFASFVLPEAPSYALVGSLDSMALLRADVACLVTAGDRERQLAAAKVVTKGTAPTELESHAIFDRGRLVGQWEYDVDAQAIVFATFSPAADVKGLAAAVKRTETFVRDELGDARSFSLDSPKSRAPRIAAIRAMAR